MFITFEGLDNSGKTTAIKNLVEYLKSKNMENEIVVTREPGGTGIKEAEFIRDFVLSPKYDIDPMSEALLFLVSRKIHLTKIIEPALKNGKIVICDRFIDSSLAYQGFGRELGLENIQKLNSIVTNGIKPDITFFIKISPELSIDRQQKVILDRLENKELGFYKKVSDGYDEIINRERKRFIVIDGNNSINEISKEIIDEFEKIIEQNKLYFEK